MPIDEGALSNRDPKELEAIEKIAAELRRVKQAEYRELIKTGVINPGPNAVVTQDGRIVTTDDSPPIEDIRDMRDPIAMGAEFDRLRAAHPDWPATKIADLIDTPGYQLKDVGTVIASIKEFERIYGPPVNQTNYVREQYGLPRLNGNADGPN